MKKKKLFELKSLLVKKESIRDQASLMLKALVKKELHYVIGLKKKIGLTLKQESLAANNIMAYQLPPILKVDKSTLKCNKPRKTPGHKTKSHIVKACEGGKEKIIRFGQQGVSTAGKKQDAKSKARRKSFKARHAKNIKKGKMSAAYWADKVKW